MEDYALELACCRSDSETRRDPELRDVACNALIML
jgi:hypothetical protein